MAAHTPTMLLMVILVSLTMATCTAALWRRSQPEGLGYWTLALTLNGVAFILFSQRGLVSDYLSIMLGNGLLLCVFPLFGEALLQFQRQRMHRWLLWGPVLFAVPALFMLLDNLPARVTLVAAVTSYQAALLLFIVLKYRIRTVGRGQYFVIAAAVIAMLTMLFRGLGTVLGVESLVQITSSTPIQTYTFLASCVIVIIGSMGLVLMTKERADAHNRQLAMHDELTGLPNRRYTLEMLTHLLASQQRSQQPLSLLMLDIDHFKLINDSCGHLAGDQALKLLSDNLRSRLRTQDHAGRWGGEEFLVILPNTTASGGLQVAENLRSSVEGLNARHINPTLRMTISIGLCTLPPTAGASPLQGVGRADEALYQAKQNGRNRVEVMDIRSAVQSDAPPD